MSEFVLNLKRLYITGCSIDLYILTTRLFDVPEHLSTSSGPSDCCRHFHFRLTFHHLLCLLHSTDSVQGFPGVVWKYWILCKKIIFFQTDTAQFCKITQVSPQNGMTHSKKWEKESMLLFKKMRCYIKNISSWAKNQDSCYFLGFQSSTL